MESWVPKVLGGFAAVLVVLVVAVWVRPQPVALDWLAGLYPVSPQHFSNQVDAEGWPYPTTQVGVIILQCIKPQSAGPHTIPTPAQREAVLACLHNHPIMKLK
jgi:hypothetical protein